MPKTSTSSPTIISESDISEYWIYAVAGNPFTRVSNAEPALIVDRNSPTQILLESLSDGQRLGPSLPIWVAVVPVDSSGNGLFTNLQTSMITLVDENILDPGAHLSVVSGIQTYWNLAGTQIEIKWDISTDEKVKSYTVYYSLQPFTDTRDAILFMANITESTIYFNTFDNVTIDQAVTYWVAVVPSDGEVERIGTNPSEVIPWIDYTPEGGGLINNDVEMSWLDQLMGGNMNSLIGIIASILIFIGAVLIIKPKNKSVPEIWELGTDEVDKEDNFISKDDDFDLARNPNDFRIMPLQKTASDILGLEYKETKALLKFPNGKILVYPIFKPFPTVRSSLVLLII